MYEKINICGLMCFTNVKGILYNNAKCFHLRMHTNGKYLNLIFNNLIAYL